MRVDIKKLPKSRVEISVVLAWDEWKKEFAHASEEVSHSVKVKGFRAGKAPRKLVEQKVGKGAILAEAAHHAIRDSYERVLREHPEIDALGKPQAEIKKNEEGGAFEYVIKTAVMPEVTLADWESGVKKINREFEKKPGVIDEGDIEKEIQKIAESRAKFVTVSREARSGDGVEIDFSVLQNGVPIENGVSRGHHMILGKGVFIPGFEEALFGMQAGEEKALDLTFPADYHTKSLAGKPARFEIKLKTVEEREIPAIDDAFALSLGKFESLEHFKNTIRDGMLEEKKTELQQEHHGNIIEVLVEATKADLPDVLLSGEREKMLAEFELQLSHMQTTLENFLEKAGKSREELQKSWEPQAKRRVLSALALEKIAKDRDIEPSTEDVEAEMNRVLQYYRSTKHVEKDIDLARLHQFSLGRLRNEKVLAFLEGLK